METSRTTETNEVDRSVANAGESYDAYWRDAAFYKRRLTGGDDKKANDKDGLTTLDVEENQDEEDDETGTRSESSGESIPSEPRPSTLPQNSVATPITIVASSPFRRQNTSNMSQTTNKSIAGPNNQTPNVRVFAQQMSKPCESNFERSFTAKKAMLNGNGDNTETKTGSQGQPSFALLRRSSQQQNHGKAPTTEQSIQSTASIGNAPIFKRQTSNPNIKLPFTSSLRKNGAETLPSLRDSDVSPDSPLSAPAVPFTEPPACDMVPVGAVKRAIDTWRGLSPDRDVLNRKVSFSTAPIKVFKTHGVDEYDRRNDEIDPVASCAEYELERRLDKMELFDVELTKGTEGLGVSIIGMGVGADAGLEKLGIFVKSITPGGAVHRDGRIRVCDQIVCVDGVSLVGVSQLFAAQTLRATSARVTFTIGRESNLEDSEIAQLIQQSLEQDRLKMLASVGVPQHPPSVNSTTQYLGGGTNVIDGVRNRLNVLLPTRTPPIAPVITSNAIVSDEEAQIRARINALEADLNGSHRIAEQMRNVLENTRTHYSQLESKYDEARVLLQNYQEREKALLEREETHVKRLREKDAQYGSLVHQLRGRIDELESRLEAMARQRASVVDGELSALRERLAACAAAKPDISAAANVDEKGNDIDAQTESTGTLTNDAANSVQKHPQRHDKLPQSSDAENDTPSSQNQQQPPPPLPQHRSTAPASGARAAGLSQRALSAAPPQPQPYERFVVNGVQLSDSHHIYMTSPSFFDDPQYGMSGPHSYDPYTGATYVLPSGAACESPVPRVSEPASPAMPSKFNGSNSGAQFRHISGGLIPPDTYHIVSGGGGSLSPGTPQPHQRNRILFPLRKRYIPSENEFWREDIEAQGLQVLQWNVDEVCQMLIHIGLDKYIPEFTVNEVTGPKFLDLDGNRLKAMGIYNHSDRSIIKKKIKTIKSRIERERKALERQSRARVAATQKASAAGLTKSSEAAGVMNASLLGAPPSAMKLISIRQ